MKNYGRMHRAETMYCMLLPYKDSMKELLKLCKIACDRIAKEIK